MKEKILKFIFVRLLTWQKVNWISVFLFAKALLNNTVLSQIADIARHSGNCLYESYYNQG